MARDTRSWPRIEYRHGTEDMGGPFFAEIAHGGVTFALDAEQLDELRRQIFKVLAEKGETPEPPA